jgi:hypothetical protein
MGTFPFGTPSTPSAPATRKQLEELRASGKIGTIGERAITQGLEGDEFALLPEEPDREAGILAARVRDAALTGTGRAATIATSPRGVLQPTQTTRRRLTGI